MSTLQTPAEWDEPSAAPRLVTWMRKYPLTAYFLLAFAGTWLMMSPLVLSRQGSGLMAYDLPDAAFIIIYIFSAYAGPFMAAMVVTGALEGRAGVRRLLRRIVQWRVGVVWYLVAIFTFLGLWLAGFILLLGGEVVAIVVAQLSLLLTVFLPGLAMSFFIAGLGEEPGWRGFALPRLQTAYGPLLGTLILGSLHALWHLPVLFTPVIGEFGPLKGALFMLTALSGTFFYTWLYNHSRGSLLPVILMHASSNAASMYLNALLGDITPTPGLAAELINGGGLNLLTFALPALLLIALTRGRLGYSGDRA